MYKTHFARIVFTLGAFFTIPLLAGCGDSTAPEGEGLVEVSVRDTPESAPARTQHHRSEPSMAVAPSAGAASTVSGTMTGDFTASIQSESGTWVDLGSPNGITVLLGSGTASTTVHGAQSVALGTYTRVRLTISDGEAKVAAGSQIGGVTLQSEATISIGGGSTVVIEKAVGPFVVTASGTSSIVFDLNAEAWLDDTALQAGVVSEAELRSHASAAVVGG